MDGPFTDEMVRHFVLTAQTHEGIRKYGEAMAQFLAEAAVASQKATGDGPATALNKWMRVIRERALQLIAEKQRKPTKAINPPGTIDG